MNGCVVIPTFNESKTISFIVKEIKKRNLDVLIIDDGSRDGTDRLASEAGAKVITHQRNMGKGLSLRSGFQKVISQDYDFIITMDGDGQHRPADIANFIQHYSQNKTEVIVGNRMNKPKNMPFHRWITNKTMSMVISSVCKTYIPDTQCGFRLIKTSVLREMVFSTSNYEIESELLIEVAKKKYRIDSVPIETVYEGQDSQINPVVDTVRFFRFLLKDRLKEAWFILKEFFNDTVIKHGSIVFLASLLCNIFNLAFWLFMVRKLNPINYGILNSMVSFLAVVSLPVSILQTVLARYFSEFKAKDNKENIKALFKAFLKRISVINFVILLIFFVLSRSIANFLNIENNFFIYLSAFSIFFSNLLVLSISSLQGLQFFPRIALNSVIQGFIKISTGVVLVVAGFNALGAFFAFVFSGFGAFVFSLFQLPKWVLKMKRKEYRVHKPNINLTDIYSYFLPVSIALISYTLFINSDIILVKHFFSQSDAGIYSIAQTVGKIILFLPGAIILVFFPVAVHHKTQNKNAVPMTKKSLLFVSALCVTVSLLTFVFPKIALRVIAGKVLNECVPLVRLIIFPMSLFALNYIFIFYNLSVRNTKYIFLFLCLSIIQILAIFVFHQTLLEIVGILTVSSLLAFCVGIRSLRFNPSAETPGF